MTDPVLGDPGETRDRLEAIRERTCGFCNVQTMTNPCHHCKALDLMVALKESIAARGGSVPSVEGSPDP